MLIKLPSKTKYFLKLGLPFVLLFQWTMPAIEMKRNININFADITFETCNDPEHSHPPLSERETSEDLEKLVNSDLNNSLIVNEDQKYFDISVEIIFEKHERFPEFLFKHFPPARSPPYLEV
ncbi:uncharacterized protein METZ01_LOCUS73477 [marine metagenome]|uniref:Uncharacterized protein n=1 Tax=marine metagenome TaxID=408172 RepID=A0A381U2D0_9ZZZZ|tara:strand:+ start:514 stop:879 length:366 start_codon:yes stop_codon:yes gene_type:complete